MLSHKIQQAVVTYITSLSPGWTAYHAHTSATKVMPRIVVSTDPTAQVLRMHTLEVLISFCWLPDDTTDNAAHDVAEVVRYGFESKGAAIASLNSILNANGIDVHWLQTVQHTQGSEGERERSIELTVRLQYRTGT